MLSNKDRIENPRFSATPISFIYRCTQLGRGGTKRKHTKVTTVVLDSGIFFQCPYLYLIVFYDVSCILGGTILNSHFSGKKWSNIGTFIWFTFRLFHHQKKTFKNKELFKQDYENVSLKIYFTFGRLSENKRNTKEKNK